MNVSPCYESRPWMEPWVMEWIILVRPMRVVALLGFVFGCLVSNRFGLGPVFILVREIILMLRAIKCYGC